MSAMTFAASIVRWDHRESSIKNAQKRLIGKHVRSPTVYTQCMENTLFNASFVACIFVRCLHSTQINPLNCSHLTNFKKKKKKMFACNFVCLFWLFDLIFYFVLLLWRLLVLN